MISKILSLFTLWRIGLFFVAFLAVIFIPIFGSRFPYKDQVLTNTHLPSWVWGFGNFDGVHYLRIAQNGYDSEYSQAFFPLYPLLVRFLSSLNLVIQKDPLLDTHIYVDPSYFFSGLFLSNLFFLFSQVIFYKLIKIDFNQKTVFRSLILLLCFPTAFYFGAIYSESLFLFLALGVLYSVRKKRFLLAGIFCMLASATRIFGLFLIPVLIIEIYSNLKAKEIKINSTEFVKAVISILIAPFGTLFYMLFLRLNFDKPLYFLTAQPNFGAERTSGSIIFLPQVFYRYIKIFTTVSITSQPFFNAALEFSFTIIFLLLLLLFIKRLRLSYLVFTFGCLILPTLTGTLSSMPRYALMSFLLFPLIVQYSKKIFFLSLCFFVIIGIILSSLFTRGYWVA